MDVGRVRAWGALFVASALMFSLEPMIAKTILPTFGGGASVWTSCLLFFQGALLVGYGVAHALLRFGIRKQAIAITLLIIVGAVMQPIALHRFGDGISIANVLGTLAISAGVPFLALSTLAPSVPRWFALSGKDPYGLYAASNAGSLFALLGYALVGERAIGLHVQSRALAIGYGVLVVLVIACALPAFKQAPREETSEREPIDRRRIAEWITLAAVPSAYLSAVTAHVTTEIAPAPLLWVLPLALYLATFVIVFGGLERVVTLAQWALPPLAALVVVVMVARIRHPVWLVVLLHVITFFVAALLCHGRLAKARPDPKSLTAYFAWIAAGGFLGAALVAILAPVVFDQMLEYPLLVFMALVLRQRSKKERRVVRDVVFVGIVGVASMGAMLASRWFTGALAILVYPCAPTVLALFAMFEPRRFAFAVVVLLAGVYSGGERVLWRSRNWYGALEVSRRGPFIELVNGTTVHGRQSTNRDAAMLASGYYAQSGPLGDIIDLARQLHETEKVFVVGLGAGGAAAYELPGESWTFFEINPDVVSIAKNDRLFSYLKNNRAEIVVGDARIEIEHAGSASLLVVDAFTSDAIPMHLMTLEAARLFVSKAHLVAWHVSNRYLDLPPMLARLAEHANVAASWRDDSLLSAQEMEAGKSASTWVLFGDAAALSGLGKGWQRLYATEGPLWTDDRSSVLDVIDTHAITQL